ncbi:MAG: FAD-dependent pyridine nucleotide-disulfide oxidoreductase [Paraburkholderia sp.]|nr:MAG: FAD-dependent pyridine nucleotide-disulfide oxidoreductase [Paraburkholderia sp.]
MTRHLLLLGGGHANIHLLEALVHDPLPDIRVTLVSPYRMQIYSGMLPGWIAGQYRLDECQIPIEKLAMAAGAAFRCAHAYGIDADARCVRLRGGEIIDYDFLAVDIGSEVRTDAILCESEHVVPVRPAQRFVERYQRFTDATDVASIAVVGGGMASAEIACALRHALADRHEVTIFAGGKGLLPSSLHALRDRILRALRAYRVKVVNEEVRRADDTGVETSVGNRFAASFVVLATGPQAPQVLHRSRGIALDESGYLKVDSTLRSLNHPEIFAAGDCTSLPSLKIKSGVYAVRQGPVLAHNVRAAMTHRRLQRFHPQRRTLYLVSTGARHAVGTWGPLSWEGDWVWKWKDRIDRRFVRRFSGSRGAG